MLPCPLLTSVTSDVLPGRMHTCLTDFMAVTHWFGIDHCPVSSLPLSVAPQIWCIHCDFCLAP